MQNKMPGQDGESRAISPVSFRQGEPKMSKGINVARELRGWRAASLLVGVALGVAACGGGDDGSAATAGAGPTTTDTGVGGGGAGSTVTGGNGGTDPGGSGGGPVLNVSQLAVGEPSFNVVGFQLFSAPLGTVTTEFVERKATTEAVLPYEEFLLDLDLLAPREPAEPPYDNKLELGVLAAGFENKERYAIGEWVAPKGIYLAALLVPVAGSAQGSSADFEAGEIIPNDIFPITVDVDLWKGGAVFDEDFDFDYPRTEDLQPGTSYDGYSHMPLFFWRNTDMIPADPDTYQFRMRVVDAQGNGWRVFIPLFVD
jgi:hypothetical protein